MAVKLAIPKISTVVTCDPSWQMDHGAKIGAGLTSSCSDIACSPLQLPGGRFMAVTSSTTEGVDGNVAAVTGIEVDINLELTSPIQKERCDYIRALQTLQWTWKSREPQQGVC